MVRQLVVGVLALMIATGAAAQPSNGEILSSAPCLRHPQSYDAYVAGMVRHYDSEALEAAKFGIRQPPGGGLAAALTTRSDYDFRVAHPPACRRVLYGSDGLKVVAYIWEPANMPAGAKLPVILALHGGNRNEAKWSPDTGMDRLVTAGFIVVGVQYRGVDGGEGQEQFGGDDVHDVVNAVTLARNLAEADPRNIFMFGASRGGMMVYLAIRDGARVNAAATISGMTDLELEAKRHRDWEAENWRPLIPNYDRDRTQALARRSGLIVAKTVDLPPVLILHGTADWRADVRDSLEIAEALEARHRPYELHIFDGDVHGLTLNSRERDRLMIGWFTKYMVR
jgi:dipeptidyl aminopeptidase/acylaminoacyl peptidase